MSAKIVAPAIKDLINGIRGAVRNADHAKGIEYIAEALKRLSTFENQIASSITGESGGTPTPPVQPPVRRFATFWFAQGAPQAASSTLNLNEYVITFPGDPVINFTQAFWKYALIYNINSPAPSMDFIVQLYLEGTQIFTNTGLVLPSGTVVGTAVSATNFNAANLPVIEKQRITGRILQSDAAVQNVTAVLVYDLVAQ